MYVLAAGAVFFAATGPINWLLIFKLGMGLDGSALAFVACELIYIACLLALCALHNARRPPQERWWRGWSRDALRGWGPFLRLTLAATAMIVAGEEGGQARAGQGRAARPGAWCVLATRCSHFVPFRSVSFHPDPAFVKTGGCTTS